MLPSSLAELGHWVERWCPCRRAGGFRLAVGYLIPAEARRLEEELDVDEDEIILRRVDATDREQVDAFMQEAVDAYGHINVVASLVGGWAGGRDIAETDDVRFDRMIDLNLRSAFYTVRGCNPSPAGRRLGPADRRVEPGRGRYPDGAGGVQHRQGGSDGTGACSAAVELEHTNVTSNALMPSVIDTEATRAALPYADYVHWPKPHEIAAVIDFLASPGSAVINGAGIPVYGQT